MIFNISNEIREKYKRNMDKTGGTWGDSKDVEYVRSSSSDRLLLMEETDDNGQEFKEEKDNMSDNTFSFDTPVVLAIIKKIVILERSLTF